jgi:hypothetical protein
MVFPGVDSSTEKEEGGEKENCSEREATCEPTKKPRLTKSTLSNTRNELFFI